MQRRNVVSFYFPSAAPCPTHIYIKPAQFPRNDPEPYRELQNALHTQLHLAIQTSTSSQSQQPTCCCAKKSESWIFLSPTVCMRLIYPGYHFALTHECDDDGDGNGNDYDDAAPGENNFRCCCSKSARDLYRAKVSHSNPSGGDHDEEREQEVKVVASRCG